MASAPVSVSMSIPFAIDSSGLVATEQSPLEALAQRVSALASTQPGERVMANRFGVNTAALLFTMSDPLVTSNLMITIAAAMKTYEPGATLKSITPILDSSGTGVASILADAVPTAPQSAAAVATKVTVRADGTVITSP